MTPWWQQPRTAGAEALELDVGCLEPGERLLLLSSTSRWSKAGPSPAPDCTNWRCAWWGCA